MSDHPEPKYGQISWRDLTVPNAEEVRDFYAAVVGWTFTDHPMGDYADYNVHAGGSDTPPVAGIVHARGINAHVPPQWLMYVTVESVDASVAAAVRLGGEAVIGPADMGGGRWAVVRDPAGAVIALWQE
jgi:predicted enzyme related to lactoylglutathione lyase